MNLWKKTSLNMLLIGSLTYVGISFAASSPIGFWRTIDDATGRPKSIVKISELSDHSLVGQVVKVFPSPGVSQNPLCGKCKGEKHNQPIVGMLILTGLKAKAYTWDQGKILDPHNGKTYDCSAKLAENGKKLNVRGYIGLPVIGRSQAWERVDIMG